MTAQWPGLRQRGRCVDQAKMKNKEAGVLTTAAYSPAGRCLYACPLGLNMSMGTGTHILVYGARIFDVTRVAGGRSRCLGLPRARCYLEAH